MKLDEARALFFREKPSVVLCGFSGGADSTAALLVAFQLCQECGSRLVAVHFDHGLREESASEAKWCEEFCRRRAIEFTAVKLEIPHMQSGVENAARQARLVQWKRLTAEYGNAVVVTGHHANDKCENLFLRLFRGSNVSGLTGLRSVSVVEKVRFLRPLLGVTRAEIEEFLRLNGVTSWVTDKSNFDSAMLRNYLRNEVLPGLSDRIPFAGAGLAKSMESLLCDAEYIEQQADMIFESSDVKKRSFWSSLHDALAVRVFRKFLSVHAGLDIPVSSETFLRFKKEVSNESSEPRLVPVAKDISIIIQNDAVDILHDVPEPLTWRWREQDSVCFGDVVICRKYTDAPDKSSVNCASFDASLLDDELILSAPESGEKFTAYSRKNPESIKKLRTDRKIAAYPVLPVLRQSSGTALWLPFIRTGNLCLVSDSTKEIVTFYASKVSNSNNK